MAGVDSTTINGLMKKVYANEDIENIQNMNAKTFSTLKKSKQKPNGQGYVFPVNVQGNQRGLGAINELEALRIPANQVPLQGTVLPKVAVEQTLQFSGLSLAIAQTNEDSFMNNLTFQTEEGMKDCAKELNQQLFRDGTGKLADVNGAVSASTSIVFDGGVPTHFRLGEYIDIYLSTTKEVDSAKITDINISTQTLTVSSAVTCTDNAVIYREDVNDNAPSDGKELAGLRLVTDDGSIASTYEAISRSTYSQWKGITLDASSANLSDDLLQRADGRVRIQAGRETKLVISNHAQFRKYMSVLTPAKEYQVVGDKQPVMDSGYETVPTWNGKKWIVDTDCGFDEVYLLNPDYIERFETEGLKLDDTNGNVLKWDNGYDGFQAYIKYYGNIGCRVPNAHVRIKNLATPVY